MRFLAVTALLVFSGFSHTLLAHGNEQGHTPLKSGIRFEENKGQHPVNVSYMADVNGGRLWLEKNRLSWSFCDMSLMETREKHELPCWQREKEIIHCDAFQVNFLGAAANPTFSNEGVSPDYRNYFIGIDPSRWASEVHLYDAIQYHNLYPSTDLRFYSQAGFLKYDFLLGAYADPSLISLDYEGVKSVKLDEEGNLVILTTINKMIEQAPFAYQLVNGEKIQVPCHFRLTGSTVSFDFPEGWDKGIPLVIDPTVIFSTYIPSATSTYGFSSTYDDAGNLYGAGISFGAGYPTTPGAYDVTFGGGVDMGVTKLNPTGTAPVWSTYIGGGGSDYPMSMITNVAGELFIYGNTTASGFPTTAGAFQTAFGGGTSDITVTRLNAAGSALIASTYAGGTGEDGSNGIYVNYGDAHRGEIMLDASDNVYIASNTGSINFPGTASGYQPAIGGGQDGVAFKMPADLSAMNWATYLGGSLDDAAYGIKVASTGTVFVCGGTNGSGFSSTPGSYQPVHGGGLDGFVVALNTTGSAALASTFVGTSSDDQAFLMDLDDAGNVYIYGQTEGTWPISPGVYSVPGSPMFINSFDPTLTTALFTTVFGVAGGFSTISPIAFLVDNCNAIYISGFGNTTGYTVTPDAYIPTTDGSDFYLAVFSPGCTALSYATYYGDPFAWDHVDGGTSRFDKNLIIYHAVCAGGSNFPVVPTPGAYGPAPGGGGWNLAVFKIQFTGLGMLAAFATFEPDSCVPHPVTFTNMVTGTGIDSAVWIFGDGSPPVPDTSASITHTYLLPGTYTIKLIVWDSSSCNVVDSVTKTLTVFPNPKPDAGPDSTYCSGDIVPLGTAPVPGWTYAWSPSTGLNDSTLANPLCSFTSTGLPVSQTYILTIIDANGCSGSDTVTVTFAIPPTPGTIVDDTACAGSPASVAYSGPPLPAGSVYNWTFTGGPTVVGSGAGPIACTWSTPGWHYITLSVTSGFCITPVAYDSIYVYPSPVVNINPVADQCYEGHVFNFTHTGSYLPGTTFLWTFSPDGSPASSTLANPTGVTFGAPGPKTVTLVVTDDMCPSAPSTINFNVLPMPVPVFSWTGLCVGDPYPFTDLTPGTNTAWLWNFADAGSTSPLQNPVHAFSTSGSFPVNLTVTNSVGCSHDTTLNVVVHPLPVPDFSFVHKCFNTITEFTNLSTLVDPFGSVITSYSWDFGDPASGPDNTSTLTDPVHSYTTAGMYTITLTVTSDMGCSQTLTRDILVPAVYPLTVQNDSVCTGYSATLYASGDWPGTTITWYSGPGGTSPLTTGPNYTTPPLGASTTYYVSLTEDNSGCESALTPVQAYVYSIPSVDITLSSDVVEVPNAIVEFTTSPFGMSQVASYFWAFGDGSTSTSPDPVHQWQQPGIYEVTLGIIDVHGCTHNFETKVMVEEHIRLFVPNIFTPNGDGINDNFTVATVLVVDLHTEIYDRWGQLVYETDNLSFEWPGIDTQGSKCQEGAYTYVMRGYAYNGQYVERKGIVLLTR